MAVYLECLGCSPLNAGCAEVSQSLAFAVIALSGLLSSLCIQGCIIKPKGNNVCFSSQMSLLSGAFCVPLCFLETDCVLLVQCPSCGCLHLAQVERSKPWTKSCTSSWSCSTGNASAGGLCQHSSAQVSSSPGDCHQPLHVCSHLLMVTGNESCLLQDV